MAGLAGVERRLATVAADGLGKAALVALPGAVVLGAALHGAVAADADRLELQGLQSEVDVAVVVRRDGREVLLAVDQVERLFSPGRVLQSALWSTYGPFWADDATVGGS